MILVTGASGRVGGQLVRDLVGAGHPVRALVRDPKAAGRLLEGGVELAAGDFADPDSLPAAFAGVERMYLLAPLAPELPQWEATVIDAAARAVVRHVVKHSNLGAADESATTMQRWHRAGEERLRASGMAWTFVRPTGFMTNALAWAGTIRAQGRVYGSSGQGRLSVVDPRDIAAVAAAALTQPGHEGKAYDVTGPEALSTADQVDLIATATGGSITYVDLPDAVAREQMLAAGLPAVIVDALLEFTALVRSGQAAEVTDTVPRVTGRPARTFQAWAQENATAFR